MSNRLSQTERKQYSSQFASKITEDFFKGKEFASGEDILNLTSIQQINHTIIQKLYGQWKKDAVQFRSPYFDFENDAVKEALENFMNIVSRHIAVKQSDLFELVENATDETLLQIFEPATYFGNELRKFPNLVINSESLKELGRFNKIHKKVVEGLSEKFASSGAPFVYVNQANRWLDELLNNPEIIDSPEPYIEEFSKVIPFELSKSQEIVEESFTRKEEKSFFDFVQKSEPKTVTTDRVITNEQLSNPVPSQNAGSNREEQTLNNSYKSQITADNSFANSKIESISGSIPLAQRFVYISQLFRGNSDEFDQSMKMLDRCSSFTEAHEFIYKSLAQRYNWDINSERVKELMVTVRRKFN